MNAFRTMFLLATVSIVGCSDNAKPDSSTTTPGRRNDAVVSTTTATTPTVTASAKTVPPKPATPHKICDTAPSVKALPGSKVEHVEAAGAPALSDKIFTGGRWMWVNLWATWCGPCKEEIPRLKGWEAKLGGQLAVGFVSLDDDRRMVQKFVDEQPAAGMKNTWWLPDGKVRNTWLEGMRLSESPNLPIHALVDPGGVVRCVINGAVEDADFAQVQAIVARK